MTEQYEIIGIYQYIQNLANKYQYYIQLGPNAFYVFDKRTEDVHKLETTTELLAFFAGYECGDAARMK